MMLICYSKMLADPFSVQEGGIFFYQNYFIMKDGGIKKSDRNNFFFYTLLNHVTQLNKLSAFVELEKSKSLSSCFTLRAMLSSRDEV